MGIWQLLTFESSRWLAVCEASETQNIVLLPHILFGVKTHKVFRDNSSHNCKMIYFRKCKLTDAVYDLMISLQTDS